MHHRQEEVRLRRKNFRGKWEGVIMNTDINQELNVGGDMNGHVCQVANGFHEAHGNFGYGTRNAGERILEFAEAMGYVVTNTLFKKRQSHLVTYESGGNKTAVDMILIKREHKKRIMNTKVIPGEEYVHGHHLVVMDMHLKVMKYRKNHQGLHKVQLRIKGMEAEETRGKEGIFRSRPESSLNFNQSVCILFSMACSVIIIIKVSFKLYFIILNLSCKLIKKYFKHQTILIFLNYL